MLKRLAIVGVLGCLAAVGVLTSQTTLPNAPKKGPVESDSTSKGQPHSESQHEDQSSPKIPSVVVQVETPTIESSRADTHEDEATRKLARYTFWLMVFTAGLVAVGVLQAVALILQARLLKKHAGHLDKLASAAEANSNATKETLLAIQRQADIMEQQAADAKESGKHTEELAKQAVRQTELTQFQLELTHRPWIAIENVSPASNLEFDERGGVLFLNLQIRNVGNSIAKHIQTFVDYAVGGVTNMSDVSARVVDQLKKPIDPNLDHGKLLFPNQVDVAQYPIIILPKYIEEALQSGHFRDQKGLSFELFICFDYQSTTHPGHHYQTRSTFGVAKINPSGGPLMAIFLPSVKVYPPQQIHIFYQGRGAHAD